MTSILRQIVAGPRAPHPEAGLDLCYVTDRIIATSGPSGTYPQRAYRNPLSSLVKFLDHKHRDNWAIWEFRAEGTGYPDSEVYGRIRHYPWPDHHPPPFALIPSIMASMRNWLHEDQDRVVVVHCKAGKGRSGTVSCSYLISEEGWTVDDAIGRFTERRMRPGFGAGVSIPSQLRWLSYVNRWTSNGKLYVERQIEILELKVFGLRDGVKITVEGFVDEGKVIKCFHTFATKEREVIRGQVKDNTGLAGVVAEVMGRSSSVRRKESHLNPDSADKSSQASSASASLRDGNTGPDVTGDELAGADAVFCPSQRVIIPTNDINIDFERRNTAAYGLTMVTAVAHVWFNAFFEGLGAGREGKSKHEGKFSLDWDKMDGIKGSSRKGTRCFDRFEVLWKVYEPGPAVPIYEPREGEEVKQVEAADWRGAPNADEEHQKDLGIRTRSPPGSTDTGNETRKIMTVTGSHADEEGTKSHGQAGESLVKKPGMEDKVKEKIEQKKEALISKNTTDNSNGGWANVQSGSSLDCTPTSTHPMVSTSDLPDGKAEHVLKTAKEHQLGHLERNR